MEHLERMKAMELGRTLPQDEPWLSPAKLAALIGGVVPLGVFVSVGTATTSSGYHEEMWLAATVRRHGRGDRRVGRGCSIKPLAEDLRSGWGRQAVCRGRCLRRRQLARLIRLGILPISLKETETVDPLIIPIVGILMPLVLVPTILVLKHRHKRREWEHRERMRAMDGPHAPHRDWRVPVGSGGVAAIGAGVPMVSVLAAFLTGLTWEPTTTPTISRCRPSPGDAPS